MRPVMERWQRAATNWKPNSDWIQIETIDAHTAGEPLRIITAGLPPIDGENVLAQRDFMHEHLDRFRKLLMWEPRGHADMYGCALVPPQSPQADFGVLFMHNEGYSSMCGHGIIAVATVAIEIGFVEKSEPITSVIIDSPAGLISVTAHVSNGKVSDVSFENVPSYVVARDQSIEIEGLGLVNYDLAFGGAYYAYLNASEVGVELRPERTSELIACGRAIKKAISADQSIQHPEHPELSFLYGTIFVGPAQDSNHHSRNVCVFADGEVDRSPTGTGVSGRAAIEFANGRLSTEQPIEIESIIGTVFRVEVAETTEFGSYEAIVPRVTGQAYLTGRNQFFVDPRDPLGDGFFLR